MFYSIFYEGVYHHMKIDKQNRLLIPAILCNYVGMSPNSTLKVTYLSDQIRVFPENAPGSEMVEFHTLVRIDDKHRVCLGKSFIEKMGLKDKELTVSVVGRTIIVRW